MSRIPLFRLFVLAILLVGTACCGRDAGTNAPAHRSVASPQATPSSLGRGAVRGRIVYDGEPPVPQKLLVVADREVCAVIEHRDPSLIVSEGGGISNVVVSVDGLDSEAETGSVPGPYVLDQRDCVFDPHVMLVPAGAGLEILNSDGVLHTVHMFCRDNPPANLAQPPALDRMTMAFERPERVQLRCDLHGWMSSWVVVVDHPYHAVSGGQGEFVIDDVPAGEITLRSWHETLGEQATQASVPAGGEVVVEFVYTSQG